MSSSPTPPRRTVLEDLGTAARNIYCHASDLSNEASVEHFFLMRFIEDLGYRDSQIKPKKSLDELVVGRGHKREKYKPDYALFYGGYPRCVIDAKGVTEDLDDWIEQCSGYCLALNRKFPNTDPARFFLLSNGLKTVLYEWNRDEPIITLQFSDFTWGNPKLEYLRNTISPKNIAKATATPLAAERPTFRFERATTSRARQLFSTCHKAIWKLEGYGPGPAFFAFVKLMFVKLWADQNLRHNDTTGRLFRANTDRVMLPKSAVTFSSHWIEQRNAEGIIHPINDMFIGLRNEIEKDIKLRQKKRIFESTEELGLRPDTVLDVVRRLEHIDLFGIDEDLNGRLFETFLNATMRGRELGQFFTPRSVVKMMTEIANLSADLKKQDKVLDGCCGSGGFLIEALTVMRNRVRDNDNLSPRQKDDLIDAIANDCIYGIDFGQDPPLARIARINMYLHGDGGSRIYHADALDKTIDTSTRTDAELIHNMEELREQLQDDGFDVVLTNPPFSMTKELKNPSERRILRQYDLARRNNSSAEVRPSLRSSVMFLERYCDVLRRGGVLVTVIDDTLLSSAKFDYVRDYIRHHYIVRAIISLPGDTFRRSGSRVKTSILVLEKKLAPEDRQPNWFYFFAEHLGMDDLNSKASEHDVEEARQRAADEMNKIVEGYRRYTNGDMTGNVLGPDRILDRLDLRNCVPLLGRMAEQWESRGIEVKPLKEIVTPSTTLIDPSTMPNEMFDLLKVSYEGRCEVQKSSTGRRIRDKKMYRVLPGQIVFSTIRASDGAVGIVPPELGGALVSKSSYTVFDCWPAYDAAYLWSILRSYEIRADMQSLSPGSGRYTTYWPEVGELIVPWPARQERMEIGRRLRRLWRAERDMIMRRQQSLAHLDDLGVESELSRKRWTASKAPQ